MDIQVGEYVRSYDGIIGKSEEITSVGCWIENDFRISKRDISNHSENVLDIIEVGDILELEEDGEIIYVGFKKETITCQYKDLFEKIENGELKLLSILSQEQFEICRYQVGGRE